MKNILTAIKSKFSGSLLSTDVSGRIYLDRAPDGCAFPYVVYFVVSATQKKTFTESYRDTLVQFSLFSESAGATEITTMYDHLKTLFDECSMTITGNSLVWMREQNLHTMIEDITTANGAQSVRHWACDYTILTSLS